MRINGATGNVLIQNGGTFTDAGFRLDVNGTARVSGDFKLGDGSQRNIIGPLNNSLGIYSSPNSTTEGILFSTDDGATVEMFLQDGGNLGIGTITPTRKLDVNGISRFRDFIGIDSSDPSSRTIFFTNGDNLSNLNTGRIRASELSIFTAVSEVFRLFQTTGNLLLQNGGTFTDAGFRLDVNGTTRFNGLSTIQGTTASDSGQLGSELTTTGSGTNWTGTSFATGYTHAVGSTVPLSTSLVATNGTYYQIAYTITGRTAGSITISYGGVSTSGITATGAVGPRAISTVPLSIVPTTDFDGTLVLSIKVISTSSASVTFNSSAGTTTNHIRISSINTNTFVGLNAGSRNTTAINNSFFGSNSGTNNTTGSSNTFFGTGSGFTNNTGVSNSFFGRDSGASNTTGASNSFFGNQSGQSNTTGGSNTAFGSNSLQTNTTGISNTAVGLQSLFNNTSSNNTAVGLNSLFSNTSGNSNTGIGFETLHSNGTGANNTALGREAGRYTGTGTTAMTSVNNSIYLGYRTRGLNATGSTNELVIGYDVVGLGSNTTVLGNTSTVTTAIYGDLLLGTTTAAGSTRLTVSGSETASGAIARGQFLNTTLVAAANNDVLVGLDINPTFTNGAFTGLGNYPLRVTGTGVLGYFRNSSGGVGNSANGVTISVDSSGNGLITAYNYVSADPTSGISSGANFGFNGSNANFYGMGVAAIRSSKYDIWFQTGVVNGGGYRFYKGTTEMFTIFENGNVGINTGSTDAGFRLDVNGTARVQGVLTTTADAVVNGVNIGRGGSNVASNTRVGPLALNGNTTGSNNTAIGQSSGVANTTGSLNSFFGSSTGQSNTTGFYNSFFGMLGGASNTTATQNSYFGAEAAQHNTTGGSNSFFGFRAGRFIADGTTNLTIASNSVFLGANTRAAADNQTNQIVIGHTAIGLGSNTTVIGNSSTTFGRWFGNLLIGTSTNNGTNLRVVGTTQSDTITQNLESHGRKVLQYTSVSSTTINLPTEFPLMTGLVVANSYAVFGKFLGKYINYGQAIEFYISKNPNGMWNTVAYSNSSQFMAALISVTGSGNDLTITTNTGTSFILELTVMTQS